jgi:protein-tyrosine phosphatase
MVQIVLFLCTGNYYRSRFAEILFNALAQRQGLSWRARSRGLALERGAHNVGPMSAAAGRRLVELGIAVDGYLRQPQQADEADLRGADRIIALKGDEHRPLLVSRYEGWAERVEYWDVHDVDVLSPAEALPAIEQAVLELVERLMKEDTSGP